MNTQTKVMIGLGAVALLFLLRKTLFGGGSESEGTDEQTPDTSGPSETTEAPKETPGDTAFKPYVPPLPTKPSLVNVPVDTYRPADVTVPSSFSPPTATNSNLFATGSNTALGGK